jgi:hypothetical protein
VTRDALPTSVPRKSIAFVTSSRLRSLAGLRLELRSYICDLLVHDHRCLCYVIIEQLQVLPAARLGETCRSRGRAPSSWSASNADHKLALVGPLRAGRKGDRGRRSAPAPLWMERRCFPHAPAVQQEWVRDRHPKLPRGWSVRGSRRQARRGSAGESDRQQHRLATSHSECFHRYPEERVTVKPEIHRGRADPAVTPRPHDGRCSCSCEGEPNPVGRQGAHQRPSS